MIYLYSVIYMFLVSTCYILISVGIPKILIFFSLNLSLLLNISISSIYFGLTVGSLGALIGKSICQIFIEKYNYSKILFICFLSSFFCFIFEFLNIISLNLYMFYIIRFVQGFFSGLIYSTVLTNLGEFYEGDTYKNFLSFITGGLGAAGPIFGMLYLILNLSKFISIVLFSAIVGAFSSLLFIKNRPLKIKNKEDVEKKEINEKNIKQMFFYQFNLVKKEKSIFFFAFSFSFSLMGSLVILDNLKRLVILYLEKEQIIINDEYIRFLSVIPLIFGSFFFFSKKVEKIYKFLVFSLFFIFILFYFVQKIIFCFFFLILAYGIHLVLLPVGSELILKKQNKDKIYYSYLTHAIRSIFSILIQVIYRYINIYFISFFQLTIFLLIINLISFFFYFLGKYFLNKK